MPSVSRAARTEGSTTFVPDRYFEAWRAGTISAPDGNHFQACIAYTFGLAPQDGYIYRAAAEVTLSQAQSYLEVGAQKGFHAWYRDAELEKKSLPTAADIEAYTAIFRPSTSTSRLLMGFASNAKKGSVRAAVAQHLGALFHPFGQTPGRYADLTIARNKAHVNPYFDFWAWSNQVLGWSGPEPHTANVKFSHAILPVLYHHFGCAVPSYEALSTIDQIASDRRILDIGSGNGYWTYMLRHIRPTTAKQQLEVVAIDNGVSEWRTMWIDDTVEADGPQWLATNDGGKNAVMLLIYPSVGHDFTAKTILAYKGRTVICAGSQNSNGFTAFASVTIAEWFEQEMPGWEKVAQVPLPSFAGKDEALFVFEKVE